MNKFAKSLVACGLLAACSAGWAATTTTTFSVSGTVVGTCTVSASALSFGTTIPTPINSNVDAQNTVTATCSNGAAYTVALSVGNGPGATFGVRKMTSGANPLSYSLFLDPARTTVWGDGTGGSTVSNNTGSGAAQAIAVFGRIPSGQTPPIGSYTDTITVTVTF